jgi:hypothetical protein
MELITASRLKDARACKRLHHLKYDLGYRPAVDAAELRFGSLIHLGLEAWWTAMKDGKPTDAWLGAALEAISTEADPFELAKARVLLTGYHLRWSGEAYEVIAVEQSFETILVNPETGAGSRTWRLAGKVDVLVRDPRDGLTKLVEHKTSSEDITPGSEYWRRLRMDGQVSVYFDGSIAIEHPADECLYDVIGKPTIRPAQVPVLDENGFKIVLDQQGQRVYTKDGKKPRETASTADGFVLQTRPETAEEFEARLMEAVAANPEKYFARGTVVRLENELDEARYDIWQAAKEVAEGKRLNRFPRNPDACVRFGKTCAFFDVCTGIASLNDPTRFTHLESVHPELAQEAAPAAG